MGVAGAVVGARLRRQHVVGRRGHAGRRMRVADRAERGDVGHGPSVPARLDCLRDQHRRARRGSHGGGRVRRRPQGAPADEGGAPYLALELVDPSGRIEARVWDDVELLDGRFAEGDAVRVLGRVERFGGRLQVQVRAVEARRRAIRPS